MERARTWVVLLRCGLYYLADSTAYESNTMLYYAILLDRESTLSLDRSLISSHLNCGGTLNLRLLKLYSFAFDGRINDSRIKK